MHDDRLFLPHPPPERQWNEPRWNESWPESEEPGGPIGYWVIWMLLGILLIFFQFGYIFFIHYAAQLTLATTWLGLAPRASARFFLPALICYAPMILLGGGYGFLAALITLSMFGLPWLILRAFRLFRLDFLHPNPAGVLVTPNLAERAQFSLRTIGAFCLLVALGCALWVAADHHHNFREMKFVVAIFIPCELLFLLGMLSRAALVWRMLFITVSTLLMLGWYATTRHGDVEDLWLILLLPADQFVVLVMLRRAGYRLGMPRPREESLPVAKPVEPQSPWDE